MDQDTPTPTTTTRTRARLRPGFVVTAVLALTGALLVGAAAASGDEEPEPISAEPLTQRAEFTDDVAVQIRNRFDGHGTDVMNLRDASRAAVVEITIQPGAVFPWHTHPGPVMINIAEGDFVYVLAEDCVEREYTAGQALIDAGGENVHTAYNPSDEEVTVVIATFLDAPAEDGLTIPVDGPDPDECPLPTP